jgi:hypothetical protein
MRIVTADMHRTVSSCKRLLSNLAQAIAPGDPPTSTRMPVERLTSSWRHLVPQTSWSSAAAAYTA